jgi:hypothetical protein
MPAEPPIPLAVDAPELDELLGSPVPEDDAVVGVSMSSPPPHPAKGRPQRRPRDVTPRRARREEWARIGLFPRM